MTSSNRIPTHLDTTQVVKVRAQSLLDQMTLEEKLSQLRHDSKGIDRLGIPEHNWWNECLHGVGRSGVATVFPQALALAATFDIELMHEVATAISTEARAKHHEAARQGDFGIYKGLTYWTPNINIFRDPRWGRGQETYGEDPCLTAEMGVAFVRGLQGDDPRHIKVIATPKHYAVHSGPEASRHSFDAQVSAKDLWETYLPAFYATVTDGHAWSVMGAYNRTNGDPCCAHPYLLSEVLRDRWGFEGYVVSDCWAIQDFHQGHGTTETAEESAALALRSGCDLNCGCEYKNLQKALDAGLLTEDDVDRCLLRLIEARMRLGVFDPPETVQWSTIPFETVGCEAHRALARKVAARSMVLLKNSDELLPLQSDTHRRIAVIGPNATNERALLGNYHGEAPLPVTILRGLRESLGPDIVVNYARGCDLLAEGSPALGPPERHLSEAISVAQRSDLIIAVMGLDATLEGEQGDASNADAAGDRTRLGLPGLQEETLRRLLQLGKPLILITMGCSPISLPWAEDSLRTHLHIWYPGQEGGHAVADVLYGREEPGGRLPITFPVSTDDLPPIEDYAMAGRTYRYATKSPQYPFGYGLGYGRIVYESVDIATDRWKIGQPFEITVTVSNSANRNTSDIIQVYLRHCSLPVEAPDHQLVAFRRVEIAAGGTESVKIVIPKRACSFIDNEGRCQYEPGEVELFIGGSQPDSRSVNLRGARPLSQIVSITGEAMTDPHYGSTGHV